MACRLVGVPSRYLSKCWYVVNWTIGNKLQWNLNRNAHIFIEENPFEMSSAKSRPFCIGLKCTISMIRHKTWWVNIPDLPRFSLGEWVQCMLLSYLRIFNNGNRITSTHLYTNVKFNDDRGKYFTSKTKNYLPFSCFSGIYYRVYSTNDCIWR